MLNTILLIILLLAVVVFVVRSLNSKDNKNDQAVSESIDKFREEMQGKFDKINDRLSSNLSDSHNAIQRHFSDTTKIITDVTIKITELSKTNEQIVNFADQMTSLENILKNPKQRGILGEYFLETLLSNILQPNQYKMQYKFPNGEIVDAAIFFNDQVIPIDAKFSLEKYNRIMEETDGERRDILEKEFKKDVQNRIDETSKYINPSNKTTDFAFMFIPAEGIYYNLLIYKVGTVEINTHDLIEYAFRKHVIIVSPTSFYAYLETVLHGLKALKMEESVKEILARISDLSRHLQAFESHYTKVGNGISTTVNAYNFATKEFKKLDRDFYKLSDGKDTVQVSVELLDKPNENI